MFITIEESKDYGNECIIYKQSILTEMNEKYYVTKIKKYVSSWSNNDCCTEVVEYESEEDARENM